jgi:FMN phosphatase YigB (HAD superfamily)
MYPLAVTYVFNTPHCPFYRCLLQSWKPFPSSYGYAVKQLGLPDSKVLMVASHPWDIAGAMQVSAAWIWTVLMGNNGLALLVLD